MISGDALKIDEEKRSHIKQLKCRFDELVYEYVTDNDATEEANTTTSDDTEKKELITEENLCLELERALSLGLERLSLMDELRIKCRSRLDFVQELYEVACDCDANKLKKLISHHGLELSETLFGHKNENANVWRSKLDFLNQEET